MRRSRRNGQLRRVSSMRCGIAFDDQNFFLVGGAFGEDSAKRIGDEGMSPEFEAAFGRALEADAIHGRDKNAVGDGVGALNRAPGVELRRAEFLLFGRMPADRRGIENNVGAAEARQARAFRIPLVPAHQHADAAEFRVEIRKAEVARSEIKFLVIERIVRNVHLAVFSEERSVGVQNHGRIVVDAGGAALEERSDDHDFQFAREFRERFGRRARDRLGKLE